MNTTIHSFTVVYIFFLLLTNPTPIQPLSMTWKSTWQDILAGGPHRWKIDDISTKQIALGHILHHHTSSISEEDTSKLRILCPLAGDDPFVHYAWTQGHEVTAVDIVPEAVEAMRAQFGNDKDWSSTNTDGEVLWKHKSNRATLFEGDMLMKRPSLLNYFDAVYDKDSFGALNLDARSKFCERIADYMKDNGTLYIEVKNKSSGREVGPPFHVEKQDLMEEPNFGGCFEHVVSLGEVYPLNMPTALQTGHVLRRLARR